MTGQRVEIAAKHLPPAHGLRLAKNRATELVVDKSYIMQAKHSLLIAL